MLEDRGDMVTTSSRSKSDYVLYSLMKSTTSRDLSVSVVVIETKHEKSLKTAFVAQVLGYYCKAKENSDKSGLAMLLS